MPIPLQMQLFDAFLGEQEGIHSLILPDIFSSGGSKNIYMDKFGRAKKIDGYSKQNSSAITTNSGGSAARFRALFPYRKTAGGSLVRQVIGVIDDATNEYELFKSTDEGENWTFVQDFGSGSINTIPDFAQFGDTLYITNGVVVPRTWDGSSVGTAGRTQSPTVSSAAVSSATGVLNGNYKWKLVSIIDGARQAGSAPSTVLPLEDKQGDLDWTADTNTDVDGYELYRTTGTGELYYFVAYIDGRTTAAYIDNTEDFDLLDERILQEHGDAPPTGTHFCEPHKQRMWWARTDTNPTRIYWSDPGLPEDVGFFSFLDVSDGETFGDHVTGLAGNYEGRLIAFTERAIWTISGTGQVTGTIGADWVVTKANAQMGSIAGRSIVRVPAGAKYIDQKGEEQLSPIVTLAYLTPHLEIRLFDGTNDIIISHPKQTTLDTINFAHAEKAYAVSDTSRSEITWVFPTDIATEPNTAITWNWHWGLWYTREWPFSHIVELDSSTESSVLLAGEPSTTVGAFCYKLWDGNNFDGDPIEAHWMTKTLTGLTEQGKPTLSQMKRWRWADFLIESPLATSELTVEWMHGYARDDVSGISSTTITPSQFAIITSDGGELVDASGLTISMGQTTTPARALLVDLDGQYLHDVGLRIRVGDNTSDGSWALEGINLAYQVLPGLQRRMP
jgi:hypothetical protein